MYTTSSNNTKQSQIQASKIKFHPYLPKGHIKQFNYAIEQEAKQLSFVILPPNKTHDVIYILSSEQPRLS